MTIKASATPPTINQLVERATDMLPRVRKHAAEGDRLRHLPDATVAEFQDAGFFKVFQPSRYGGFELDYGATQLDLCNQLGRASGSAAWVQSVVACHAWLAGMYPQEAQDAVWAKDADTLVASAFSRSTGRGTQAEGGLLLEGDWEFSSGVHACQWVILSAVIEPEKTPPPVLFCLVPRGDFEILETWDSSGLRSTGSHGVRVKRAFVPESRVLDTGLAEAQRAPGGAINESYIYRLPLWTVFGFNICAPAIGIARGGLDAFVDLTRSRPGRADEPALQLRLAESAVEVDCADSLLRADAVELKRLVTGAAPPSPELRAKCGRDLAFAALLCARSLDRLMAAVGAHGIEAGSAIERARADAYAVINHHGLSWDGHGARYGNTILNGPVQRRA